MTARLRCRRQVEVIALQIDTVIVAKLLDVAGLRPTQMTGLVIRPVSEAVVVDLEVVEGHR